MTDDELRAYIHGKVAESRTAKGTKERVHSVVQFQPPDHTLWRAKAIVDLYEWMQASDDYNKTIQIWAAVYIRCGTCARGFSAWYESCEVGPEDDLSAWLEAAKNVVLEKRWI